MNDESPSSIVLKFIEYINKGDIERTISLMSEEFIFTDIPGRVYHVRGKESHKQFWSEYLSAYPNYKIHIHHVLTSGNGVAIIGKTTGSHVPPEIEEKETVLWIAEVTNGLISEWRIYSDEEEAEGS